MQIAAPEREGKKLECLLLHGRALIGVSIGKGGSRSSNSSKVLGVVEAEQLDAVQGVKIAVPCSENLDVLWACEVRNL